MPLLDLLIRARLLVGNIAFDLGQWTAAVLWDGTGGGHPKLTAYHQILELKSTTVLVHWGSESLSSAAEDRSLSRVCGTGF